MKPLNTKAWQRRPANLTLAFLVASLFVTSPALASLVVQNITYDANGNRQSAFGFYYEYNGFNQLIRVRQINATGTIIEEYIYDHEGNRVAKIAGNESTLYVNDNFVRTVNQSGTFDTVYYYDERNLIGRLDPDGKRYFYHPDHLGSTTLITNESGQVVEETVYEPYGQVLSGGSDRYDYTGKETDIGTGLAYYGARYYDPAYAQFTQPDSNIPDPYNPQSLNGYSYTLNNPYKYTDPDGNVPLPVISAAVFAAVFAGIEAYSQLSNGGITDVGSIAAAGVGGAVFGATLFIGGPSVAAAIGGGQVATYVFSAIAGAAATTLTKKVAENKLDIKTEDLAYIAEAGVSSAVEATTGIPIPATSRATASYRGTSITGQPSQSYESSTTSSARQSSTSYTQPAATDSKPTSAQQTSSMISYEKRGKGYVMVIYKPRSDKQQSKTSSQKSSK